MINKFTILGERCSGTNYLEVTIINNFDVNVTWEYGRKHFFGFNDLSNSDDTLFICIIRDPYDWMNSLYRVPYHLPPWLRPVNNFLNNQFCSFDADIPKIRPEIMEDRHIYTKERYKNIFEMRYTKLKYMLEDLPKSVKNYIFIRYEDLRDNYEETMNKFKDIKDLKIRDTIEFPIKVINGVNMIKSGKQMINVDLLIKI